MAKLLSNREGAMLRLLIVQAGDISRLCPDVGMGPSRLQLAEEVAKRLPFEIDEDDLAEAAETVSGS